MQSSLGGATPGVLNSAALNFFPVPSILPVSTQPVSPSDIPGEAAQSSQEFLWERNANHPGLLSAPTLSFCPEFVATRAAPRSPQAQTLEKPVPPGGGREGEGKTGHLGLKMVPPQTRKLYSQLSKFPICNSEHAKPSRR